MTVEFLLTSLVIVATPGTGVLYTVAAGLSRGARAGAVAALGCTLGIVPHLIAAITGLAALLHTSAVAFQVLRYLGVAYLLYLAVAMLRDRDAFTVAPEPAPRPALRVIGSAILVNLLNPKLMIFFVAFLPQFVGPGSPDPTWRMAGLSAVFMALTLVVFAGYGAFAAAVRDHIARRPRVLTWLRRGFAGTFVALGVRLAVSDR